MSHPDFGPLKTPCLAESKLWLITPMTHYAGLLVLPKVTSRVTTLNLCAGRVETTAGLLLKHAAPQTH
jgi:hypothetical protein